MLPNDAFFLLVFPANHRTWMKPSPRRCGQPLQAGSETCRIPTWSILRSQLFFWSQYKPGFSSWDRMGSYWGFIWVYILRLLHVTTCYYGFALKLKLSPRWGCQAWCVTSPSFPSVSWWGPHFVDRFRPWPVSVSSVSTLDSKWFKDRLGIVGMRVKSHHFFCLFQSPVSMMPAAIWLIIVYLWLWSQFAPYPKYWQRELARVWVNISEPGEVLKWFNMY